MRLKNVVLVQRVTEKQETDHRKIYHGYWVHYYRYKTNFLPILEITNNTTQLPWTENVSQTISCFYLTNE